MSNNCNWRLEAISNAARNRKKTSFVLKAGENRVGKKKDCHLKIPSVLCSREHCTIVLDQNKVVVSDTSRNGTYITFSGDIGTKHYVNEITERALEENDMISFGFNTASVYDVNDKNAFIYRLVKEVIEVIDLDDSDDDTPTPAPPPAPPSAPSNAKIIEIDNKIINIPSDSDSEYSGDECLQDADEMDDGSVSSSGAYTDDLEELSTSASMETDESDEDANFVVTKTIACGTPTETIALDEDSSENDEQSAEAEAAPNENESSQLAQDGEKDNEFNGAADVVSTEMSEQPSTSQTTADTTIPTKNVDECDTTVEHKEVEAKPNSSTNTDEATRLANVRKRVAEKLPKKIGILKPQPLKKRRQTLTEAEYIERKQQKKRPTEEQKRLRLERLADIGNRQKAERDKAAENAKFNRIPFTAKVKNAQNTPAAQLCTDMLALNPTNT